MSKALLKKYIQDNCILSNGKWCAARLSEKYLNAHVPELYNELMQLYNDSSCLHESIYRLLNDIDVRPVCKVCGNPVNYSKQYKFSTFCSSKCVNSDPDVLSKNSKAVTKALKKAYAERGDEIKKKRAKSLTGDENASCSPFALKSCQEKIKQTTLERYGVDNVFRLKEFHCTKELHYNSLIKLWDSRGVNVSYTDNHEIIVHNACPVHGDITISTSVFQARWRRLPTKEDGTKDLHYLCRECYPLYMTNIEKVTVDILDEIGVDYVFRDRQTIKPYEIDFWIPKYQIGVECHGMYWHSTLRNDKEKYQMCYEKGIHLITILEDDILNYTSTIKALLYTIIKGYKKKYWNKRAIEGLYKSSINILPLVDKTVNEDTQYNVDINNGVICISTNNYSQYIYLEYLYDYYAFGYNNMFNTDIMMVNLNKGVLTSFNREHYWEGSLKDCEHLGYFKENLI